jgi:hypothetical protein
MIDDQIFKMLSHNSKSTNLTPNNPNQDNRVIQNFALVFPWSKGKQSDSLKLLRLSNEKQNIRVSKSENTR